MANIIIPVIFTIYAEIPLRLTAHVFEMHEPICTILAHFSSDFF